MKPYIKSFFKVGIPTGIIFSLLYGAFLDGNYIKGFIMVFIWATLEAITEVKFWKPYVERRKKGDIIINNYEASDSNLSGILKLFIPCILLILGFLAYKEFNTSQKDFYILAFTGFIAFISYIIFPIHSVLFYKRYKENLSNISGKFVIFFPMIFNIIFWIIVIIITNPFNFRDFIDTNVFISPIFFLNAVCLFLYFLMLLNIPFFTSNKGLFLKIYLPAFLIGILNILVWTILLAEHG